jgi:hypothetical protein
MIAFDLQCSNGHTFEGWFEDNKAYNDQKKKDLIGCPVCNNTVISKLPSAFAIKSARSPKTPSPQSSYIENMGKEIVSYVEKNFDDVGTDFAKEALKIHYGAEEPRNIRGSSTKEEEKTLKEEGVEFFKVPASIPPDTDS